MNNQMEEMYRTRNGGTGVVDSFIALPAHPRVTNPEAPLSSFRVLIEASLQRHY